MPLAVQVLGTISPTLQLRSTPSSWRYASMTDTITSVDGRVSAWEKCAAAFSCDALPIHGSRPGVSTVTHVPTPRFDAFAQRKTGDQ